VRFHNFSRGGFGQNNVKNKKRMETSIGVLVALEFILFLFFLESVWFVVK